MKRNGKKKCLYIRYIYLYDVIVRDSVILTLKPSYAQAQYVHGDRTVRFTRKRNRDRETQRIETEKNRD